MRDQTNGWSWVFGILVGLWACNKTETFSYADEGSLCLHSNADGVSLFSESGTVSACI